MFSLTSRLGGLARRLAPSLSLFALVAAAQAQTSVSGFNGLSQLCQIGTPPGTVSLDTPTASVANSFNWIVEVANSQIAVYQKGGQLAWRNTLGGNPYTFGSCPNQNTLSFFGGPLLGGTRIVDTKVLYDRVNARFCVIGMQQNSALATGQQGLYVAWSNNDNPLPSGTCPGGGGWRQWRTPVPNLGNGITYQPDFNGMGQTSTHIIWSGILQPLSQPNSAAYTFYRYFRKSDLNAGLGTLPYNDIIVQRPTSEFAHAADVFDANTPMYLVSTLVGSNALRLTAVNLGSHTEINTQIQVPPFLAPTGAAPQIGNSFLDTIDGRMQTAVVRNGSLYCAHTVATSSGIGARNVVRWYQIALNTWPAFGGVPQVIQSGNIDLGVNPGGAGVHTFMPSLAVDSRGTVFVTYARSAANESPSVAWSARRTWDPSGSMPLGGNNPAGSQASGAIGGTLKAGNSNYTSSLGTGSTSPFVERWGDWSSAVVDEAVLFGGFISCGAFADFGPPLNLNGATCNLFQNNHWRTWIHGVRPNLDGQFTAYGSGFPGTNGVVPEITPGPQFRIGFNPNIGVTNSAGAPTLGLALVSLAPAAGVPSGFGPLLWIDLNQSSTLTFPLDANSGLFSLSIPYDPVFFGTSLFLQAAVIDAGAVQGFSSTAAVQAVIGA